MTPSRGWWPFPPLRLRHKLAISLSIAALLPVLVASWVAVSVVFRSLSTGVLDDAARQLEVGLNLLLRNGQRLGQDAVQVASVPRLAVAVEKGPAAISEVLEREAPYLPAALIQVADVHGELRAHKVIGNSDDRFSGLGVAAGDPILEAGLAFERRLTLAPVGDELVVRASAPIIDDSYGLHGVVVLSLPLDSAFADSLKGALGTDVMIFAGAGVGEGRPGPAMATFLDPVGARIEGLEVSPAAAHTVVTGETAFSTTEIREREYTVAYAPLYDIDGAVVGVFAVAVDRAQLVGARRAAIRSLILGAAGAFVFAIGLAGLLSRRITRPIARLHQGAISIARGDLESPIDVAEGDEIGDLATAFSNMTTALKENQARLAARMQEIVALHDAGRAVSAVIELDQVLRKIADQVARVMSARVCAIWLREQDGLRLGAVRAKRLDLRTSMRGDEGIATAKPLVVVAEAVIATGQALRLESLDEHPEIAAAAVAAGVEGSLMAVPLERKGIIVGVIVLARPASIRSFSPADHNLLSTFADQAAAAIENARLYREVRNFNEELEAKVRQRTAELIEANRDLERAISELKETQAQLVLSERLAGLGQLVAGVAHEINSPAAAIAGSIDAFSGSVAKLTSVAPRLADVEMEPSELADFFALADEAAALLRNRMVPSPALVRRTAKQLRAQLEERGVSAAVAEEVARGLADLVPEPELLARFAEAVVAKGHERDPELPTRVQVLVGYLREYVYLHRGAQTIESAIRRIQRIVGSLKSYSHLDQQARSDADLHEGIDNTLVILEHVLGGIHVRRNYGDLPPVSVFVDELNQVWTNLLHNAVQALAGTGNIVIETGVEGDDVVVRIIDDGPGIAPESLDKIFEPFYTTKPKGEGTGLGLRIVKQIVDKHGGSIRAISEPGRTCFEVRIPALVQVASRGAAG